MMVKSRQYKWVVWVGATEQLFEYREDAQDFADSWTEQGYDDVVIEPIKEYEARGDQ